MRLLSSRDVLFGEPVFKPLDSGYSIAGITFFEIMLNSYQANFTSSFKVVQHNIIQVQQYIFLSLYTSFEASLFVDRIK